MSAKASYQSDVTEIPVDLPGIDIRGIRKDQYQAMLQLDQVVWDGGNIRARKEVTRATSEVDKQKLEVDMYAINERVTPTFFWHPVIERAIEAKPAYAGRITKEL